MPTTEPACPVPFTLRFFDIERDDAGKIVILHANHGGERVALHFLVDKEAERRLDGTDDFRDCRAQRRIAIAHLDARFDKTTDIMAGKADQRFRQFHAGEIGRHNQHLFEDGPAIANQKIHELRRHQRRFAHHQRPAEILETLARLFQPHRAVAVIGGIERHHAVDTFEGCEPVRRICQLPS